MLGQKINDKILSRKDKIVTNQDKRVIYTKSMKKTTSKSKLLLKQTLCLTSVTKIHLITKNKGKYRQWKNIHKVIQIKA